MRRKAKDELVGATYNLFAWQSLKTKESTQVAFFLSYYKAAPPKSSPIDPIEGITALRYGERNYLMVATRLYAEGKTKQAPEALAEDMRKWNNNIAEPFFLTAEGHQFYYKNPLTVNVSPFNNFENHAIGRSGNVGELSQLKIKPTKTYKMEVGELGGGGKMDNYPAKKIYADIIDPNTSIDNSPYERAVKKEQLDQMPGPFDNLFFRALGLIEAAAGGIGNAGKGKNTLHGGSYKNNTVKTSPRPNNSRSNASVYNYSQQNPAPNPQNPLIPNKSQYSLNPNLGNTNKVTAPEPIPKVVPQSATKQKKAAEQKAAEKAAEKKVAEQNTASKILLIEDPYNKAHYDKIKNAVPKDALLIVNTILSSHSKAPVVIELFTDLLIGSPRTSDLLGIIKRFDLDKNPQLFKETLNYIGTHKANQVELTAVISHINSLTDVNSLKSMITDNVKVNHLFRGTTIGFEGKGNNLAGVTSTSTDPVIATLFALHADALSQGKGFVIIAVPKDLVKLKATFPNDLAKKEREVAIDLLPTDFRSIVNIEIPAEKSRQILQNMGIKLPSKQQLMKVNFLDEYLKSPYQMTPKQISEYLINLSK